MKTVTPTELRANIYNLLEEVLTTGIPIEIKKDEPSHPTNLDTGSF